MPLRIARAALDRRALTLGIVALLTLVLGACAAFGLRIDNSIDAWLPAQDAEVARYKRFRGVFGEDTFYVVAFDGVGLCDPGPDDAGSDPVVEPNAPGVGARELLVARLEALAAKLATIDGVDRVVGPSNSPTPSRATAHLASSDGGSIALIVYTRPLHGDAAAARHAAIESAADGADIGSATFIAGPEAINHALDRGSTQAFALLFPIVVLVVAITLMIALRSVWPVIGILLVAAISSVWTLGAVALADRPLNMVLSTLPSLLVVLGTAYSLHLANAFRRDEHSDIRERWSAAIADTLHPCLLTAGTTAAGFLALAVADLLPVRDLGLFAGLGTLCSVALVFTFLPAFLHVVWSPAPHAAIVASAANARAAAAWSPARAIHRGRFAILAIALVAVAVAAAGIARLRVESHILSFFPDNDPVVVATRHIEERLLGLTALDVWVHGPTSGVLSAATVIAVRDLVAFADTESDVTDVVGPIVSDSVLPERLPADAAATALREALAARADDAPPGTTRARVQTIGDATHLRVTVAARTTSIEESAALLERLGSLLTRDLPPGVVAETTGAVPLLVRVQAMLLRTQMETFAASIVVVTSLLCIAFRSVSLALLSLVPNVLPITLTLGTMGWCGVPLDVATVTVAGVAMGLVVDDTIHILERYARSAGPDASAIARIDSVFRTAGRPVIFTSLATAAGFAAFACSDFQPVFFFGSLIALTAIYALIADLLVLPALLMVRA